MVIRIEARIEPNVTRMARIPKLNPNNDPNVDPNRDKYGRMHQKRHRHDFPGGIYECAGALL